jgi:hypothetical protein
LSELALYDKGKERHDEENDRGLSTQARQGEGPFVVGHVESLRGDLVVEDRFTIYAYPGLVSLQTVAKQDRQANQSWTVKPCSGLYSLLLDFSLNYPQSIHSIMSISPLPRRRHQRYRPSFEA